MRAVSGAEKKFRARLTELPEKVTPGFQLRAYRGGRLALDAEWGRTWKYYDLASLTKIFFTVPWMMKAVETKLVDLERPLEDYLPWAPQPAKVERLLMHLAGNDWWKPFYKQLSLKKDVEFRKNELRALLRAAPPHPHPAKSVYSDIDFFLLGFLNETVFEQSWNRLWEVFRAEVLDGAEMFFHPENNPLHSVKNYAPTEKSWFGGGLLQGQVHDENAWALGGVAPHAGLFGTLDAACEWGLWLRRAYRGEDPWLKASTVKRFAQRAMPSAKGDWGLGFMLPTEGGASCGPGFSLDSIGHTGFTGTSFWFDPKQDIFIVLLSNRVHPTRANEEFRRWRPRLHSWVLESLKD